jgi:hypothetical protein
MVLRDAIYVPADFVIKISLDELFQNNCISSQFKNNYHTEKVITLDNQKTPIYDTSAVYVYFRYCTYSVRGKYTVGGVIKGILRGVRCTKSLRVLFLHRRPPSWTTLVLYSRAVFIFNEPAL